MDDDKNIKVFGKDDEGLKSLGKLLSNETSRKIMVCLRDEPMYVNQIAKKLNLQMNLIIHHIKLLMNAGLLITTEKKITRKGIKHTHYQVIPDIFINITETKADMHEKGFLKRIFRDGVKFLVIALVAITSFLTYSKIEIENTWGNMQDVHSTSLEIPFLIIIIGLIIERIYSYIKNKKRK